MRSLQLRGNRGLALVLIFAGVLAGWAKNAMAVSVTTLTYASDTGPAIAPNLNPDVKGPTTVGGTTTAVSSIKSNTTRAHATASATSKVVGGVITKTASGSGWVDAVTPPNFPYDSKGFSWSSSASGTQFIAITKNPTDLTNPAQVPFSINFPDFNDTTIDYGFDTTFQNAFGGAAPPAQGVLRRNAGLAPGATPSGLTEPVLEVSIIAIQPGVIDRTLFRGKATFRNDVNNIVVFEDDFVGVNAINIVDAATGTIRTALTNLPKISFSVDPDKEFELLVDVKFSLGDPLAAVQPLFDFPDTMSGNFGVAGGFNISPKMDDVTHFNLFVVPEPASGILAFVGIAAFAKLRVRSRRYK